MNVCRAPGLSGTLEPLLQWISAGPTIDNGDFNIELKYWQLQTLRQYGNGHHIMEWAKAQDRFIIMSTIEMFEPQYSSYLNTLRNFVLGDH